ncbi:hypothetical protein Y1Q_0014841 [Alligator mississippiensis]|uniref:Uncharacterized protein n=1 Tax=Alligator mississippiensis TaxID=8496 RepID=A0A151M236_ALLMI|nr:hypothetical protein Y1Q_0014841 [Alligator mississippiensis]
MPKLIAGFSPGVNQPHSKKPAELHQLTLVFRWCLVSVKESIIYRERGKAFQMVKAIWEAALYQPWWTGKTDKNKPGIKEVLVMAGVQDKKSKPSMSMGGPSG